MKRKATKSVTSAQVQVARQYGIPLEQAHTINLSKVQAYENYLKTPKVQVELFLDALEEERREYEEKQSRYVVQDNFTKQARRSLR